MSKIIMSKGIATPTMPLQEGKAYGTNLDRRRPAFGVAKRAEGGFIKGNPRKTRTGKC